MSHGFSGTCPRTIMGNLFQVALTRVVDKLVDVARLWSGAVQQVNEHKGPSATYCDLEETQDIHIIALHRLKNVFQHRDVSTQM